MCQNNCSGVTVFKGTDGVGISNIVDNGDGTFTFYYTDGNTFTTSDLTGPAGPTGPAGTGVGGSGTTNYVARFTPDGTTLGNSVIQDDGTRIGVGIAPASTGGTYKAYLRTTNDAVGITAEQKTVAGSTVKVAIQGIANGTGGTGENLGFNALGSGSTTQNTGIKAGATSTGAASSLGGLFNASGGVTNHAIQLVDGTQTVGGGKFLRDMGDGKANWAQISKADITNGIDGGGTNNYVARWTPDGTTLGNSLIQDDGTRASIGSAPISSYKFRVASSQDIYSLTGVNTNTSGGIGVFGIGSGTTSSTNYGVYGQASNSSTENIGVNGDSTQVTIGSNIGIKARALNGNNNYAAQFNDGTQGLGKVLVDITGNGHSNWGKVTSTYTTGASGTFTTVDGKTATVTNGLITSLV